MFDKKKNKNSLYFPILLCLIIFVNLISNINSWGWGGNNNRQNKKDEVKKDLYKILELTKKANKDEIKKKYKTLSRKYHPDKNPNNKEIFIEITEAYEILSDAKLRRVYDTKGYTAAKESQNKPDNHQDDMDPFSHFFGGQMRRQNKMEDFRIKLKVSLKDLYNGKELEFKYTRNIICPHCRGIGADSEDDIKTCPKCQGNGVILERRQLAPGYVQQFQRQCPSCGGKGTTIKKHCHVCHGDKIIPTIEELTVFVEKGMKNGQEIVSLIIYY